MSRNFVSEENLVFIERLLAKYTGGSSPHPDILTNDVRWIIADLRDARKEITDLQAKLAAAEQRIAGAKRALKPFADLCKSPLCVGLPNVQRPDGAAIPQMGFIRQAAATYEALAALPPAPSSTTARPRRSCAMPEPGTLDPLL